VAPDVQEGINAVNNALPSGAKVTVTSATEASNGNIQIVGTVEGGCSAFTDAIKSTIQDAGYDLECTAGAPSSRRLLAAETVTLDLTPTGNSASVASTSALVAFSAIVIAAMF
jgi:hypothetical protein